MQFQCLLMMKESCILTSWCVYLCLYEELNPDFGAAGHRTSSMFFRVGYFDYIFSLSAFFTCMYGVCVCNYAYVVCVWVQVSGCVCSCMWRPKVDASNHPPSLFCLFIEAVWVLIECGSSVRRCTLWTAELALITVTVFYETQINPSHIFNNTIS